MRSRAMRLWFGGVLGILLATGAWAQGVPASSSGEALETTGAGIAAFAQTGTVEKGPAGKEAEEVEIPDPLEPWNRAMFTFNDRFYFWVFKPFTTGYNAVIPEDFRVCFRNVFNNAVMPVRFLNNLFQLKFENCGIELARFLINSTIGFGGLVDAANYIDLKPREEDFGQTLGWYGLDHGFYFVWPFLGASSARDTVGMAADSFMNPINWLLPGAEWVFGASAYRYTNDQSLRVGEYEDLIRAAVDPYEAVKDAYAQYRKKQVAK
jgi:phospholipid-binding lipoprotein MlaA